MEHWKNYSLENLTEDVDGISYKEEWRDISGFEEIYQISSFGRIKRKSHSCVYAADFNFPERRNRVKIFDSKIKAQRLEKSGYLYADFYKNNKPKRLYIHPIVGNAFIDKPAYKVGINHKKGIRSDNRFWELEWMTQKENVIHARDVLKVVFSPKGIDNKRNKAVIQLDTKLRFVNEYYSIRYAANILKLHSNNISKACLRKRKTCGGFKWMYKEDYENYLNQNKSLAG